MDRGSEIGVEHGRPLVERLPPHDREVHDRHVEPREEREHRAAARAHVRVGGDTAHREVPDEQQFEQGRPRLAVAVVRRGRQKQAVLEVRSDRSDRFRALRVGCVPAPSGRCDVVNLVDDEQVKGPRVGRSTLHSLTE